MNHLKRSMKLLTGLLLSIGMLGLSACGQEQQGGGQAMKQQVPEAEKEPIVWRLAQTWGTGFPIFGDAVEKMAEMVNTMSDGELVIRIDSANKHKAFAMPICAKADCSDSGEVCASFHASS